MNIFGISSYNKKNFKNESYKYERINFEIESNLKKVKT